MSSAKLLVKGHSIMTKETKMSDDLQGKFLSGEISREEFWSEINSLLNEVRRLQGLLLDKNISIEVSKANLILTYQIWSNKSIKLVIPKNDLRTASFTILANGHYESLLENVIFELSEKSKKFLDIGANMGFYSLGASLVNEKLQVLAFEPNPVIRESLMQNIDLNDAEKNIEIIELALSNFKGEATFSVPAFTGSGGGSLKNLHPEEGAPTEFTVEVEKLDNLRKRLNDADLLKIDVEGAEFQLIKGGMEFIVKNRPTIVIELLRKWMKPFQSSPQDVIDLLSELNYICFAVSESSLIPTLVINDSTIENNFIFCHRENLNHLELLTSKCKEDD
jgi:FkbM family methyltransferase